MKNKEVFFFGKNGSLIVIKINDNGRKYMQHQKDN